MSAIEKTAKLVRMDIDIDLLDPQDTNPNEMSEAEFNLLYDNFEKVGFVDAVMVRPKGDGRYRIVGGYHRTEVAKLHGFQKAPCTVIMDPEFDEDQEKFQITRMNMIRGKLNPKKFMELYQSLDQKYADEVLAEAFGFADENEFNKIVGQMAKTLPKELQTDFKKAAKEIKTIDGLSKLLNSMFARYGDTLDHGYMVLDYGKKESIWLRMSNATHKATLELGKRCMESQVTMDDVLGGLVQLIAQGKLDSEVAQLIAQAPKVAPASQQGVPTYEGAQTQEGEHGGV